MSETKKKRKVLIADDSMMNRALLIEMLGGDLEVIEVENGREAVEVLSAQSSEISLLLLDIMMPEMDGFEVLAYMNKYHWIEDVPVIIISSETAPSYIERAYDFGATDFISRPFDAVIVRRRVENTLLLFAKQRRLAGIVTEQLYESNRSNRLMISILSHIVEFRNGESGLHVLHINVITELLLRKLMEKGNQYGLNRETAELISMASTLHDIGKISVPDEILNKPGKFTDEEYAVMKGHSMAGANMLSALPLNQREEPLVKVAYEICRWHHERYDGRGYPDGLSGDEIPISAQVVSLADVYDALTSERCYKKAFSHPVALQMILNGECGAFNPLLLECLKEIAPTLEKELQVKSPILDSSEEDRRIAEQLREYELSSSERMVSQLDFERQRVQFLSETTEEVIFTYNASPPLLTVSRQGARILGVPEQLAAPLNESGDLGAFREALSLIWTRALQTTPEQPEFQLDSTELSQIEPASVQGCLCHTIWPVGGDAGVQGVIGKLILKEGGERSI